MAKEDPKLIGSMEIVENVYTLCVQKRKKLIRPHEKVRVCLCVCLLWFVHACEDQGRMSVPPHPMDTYTSTV